MTNAELVKAARHCADTRCKDCEMEKVCLQKSRSGTRMIEGILNALADALEEKEKEEHKGETV